MLLVASVLIHFDCMRLIHPLRTCAFRLCVASAAAALKMFIHYILFTRSCSPHPIQHTSAELFQKFQSPHFSVYRAEGAEQIKFHLK
jgi:hypothetical protein